MSLLDLSRHSLPVVAHLEWLAVPLGTQDLGDLIVCEVWPLSSEFGTHMSAVENPSIGRASNLFLLLGRRNCLRICVSLINGRLLQIGHLVGDSHGPGCKRCLLGIKSRIGENWCNARYMDQEPVAIQKLVNRAQEVLQSVRTLPN